MSEQLNMEQFFGDKINSFGEPHLACALLLDASASMGTENRAIDSDPLPENARKAEKDRAIDSDWY